MYLDFNCDDVVNYVLIVKFLFGFIDRLINWICNILIFVFLLLCFFRYVCFVYYLFLWIGNCGEIVVVFNKKEL